MTAKSAEEIEGLEFDWLATDSSGHVAVFSTAGGGYAPAEFLRNTDAHDAAISAILSLPVRTRARFAPELAPHLRNTWKLLAERGLFAFDSDPHGSEYRMVAAPEIPVHLGELPASIGAVVSRLALPKLRFEDQREVPDALLRVL